MGLAQKLRMPTKEPPRSNTDSAGRIAQFSRFVFWPGYIARPEFASPRTSRPRCGAILFRHRELQLLGPQIAVFVAYGRPDLFHISPFHAG